MIKESERVGSGFDCDYPMGEVIGIPICHVCQHRIWGNENRECEIYENPPERYIAECEEVDCENLKIDKNAVVYNFFKERIEKGEIKNGTKA